MTSSSTEPNFAIVDWEMFAHPILVYMGPNEVPRSLYPRIRSQFKKSRYGDKAFSWKSFIDYLSVTGSKDVLKKAHTQNLDDSTVIRIWTYSDPVLLHELLHAIEYQMKIHDIQDEEFKCYALEWLFADFRCKLTGRWDTPVHFSH